MRESKSDCQYYPTNFSGQDSCVLMLVDLTLDACEDLSGI